MSHLLAKSYDRNKYSSPPDYALLTQHSRDVAESCRALADSIGRVAFHCMNLDESKFDEFHFALRANGWLQDIGKANSHFNEMVSGSPNVDQLLRHETVSGILMLLTPQFCGWRTQIDHLLMHVVWSAIGHHRKFSPDTQAKQSNKMTVHTFDPDFRTILTEMAADLGLNRPIPAFDRDLIITRKKKEGGDFGAYESLMTLMLDFEDKKEAFVSPESMKFLALNKAFGIAADVSASAIASEGKWATNYSLRKYITDSFKIGLSSEELTGLINNWAWNQQTDKEKIDCDLSKLPPGFTFRKFQNKVADSGSILTLAQAGCGSGKSLAAYLWARKWCSRLAAEGRTNMRLFVCLPTTGTTTEHFKDYALESGIDASLTHSRAEIDLQTIAETAAQEEASDDGDDTAKAATDALRAECDKLESLASWSTPLCVTTTDTVLGLMANARKSIYSFPSIINSAIVFDEIHAFDEQMFGHLLVFLQNFPNIPVLLMTASLPRQRLNAIKKICPHLNCLPGPPELERLPRHLLNDSATDEEMWRLVDNCLADNGKVLWVRNRVDWANDTYVECKRRYKDVAVNVYHARLRYKDRSHRHRQVIDIFKDKSNPSVLVSTQVAEMSLDLSADLLITDKAPVPSLIQRLGRHNRKLDPKIEDKTKMAKKALIRLLPEDKGDNCLPYNDEQLSMADLWLAKLLKRQAKKRTGLSQKDLACAFGLVSNDKEFDIDQAQENACFFSGLWKTRPGQVRGEGHTISVILKQDLDNCKEFDRRGLPTRNWLRQHEVSIPIKAKAFCWPRVAGIRIAPREDVYYDYDKTTREGTGAKWLES